MGYENTITKAISTQLNNPLVKVLKEIRIERLLKKSRFIKKEGAPLSTILLHFISMIVMNRNIASFVKYSSHSFKKDTYYRMLASSSYQWQKLLLQSAVALISKVKALHRGKKTQVLILDDTVESKRGKYIEGVCDRLFSNKEGRLIRGLNMVSLSYNDGYSNFILDFALKFNANLRISIEEFKHRFYHSSEAHKRKQEGLQSKLEIAVSMVQRALKAGIRADYLLIDSWYSKPVFIKQIKEMKLDIITRIANNPKIWNFKDNKRKTLDRIHAILVKTTRRKRGHYNSIQYTYCSTILKHHTAGRVKIVFLKTKNNLVPLLSTDITLTDERIIDIYKRRWNIEQGYKELREYFGFGKEENRIYEALIARITLSLFSYNIVSYLNRIDNEPQTLGGLFRDLECELDALAISMEIFIKLIEGIIEKLEEVEDTQKAVLVLAQIVSSLRVCVRNELEFWCES